MNATNAMNQKVDMSGLKKRREVLGISQMKLAQKVGVSILTIQLWERGVGTPKEDNQKRLEEVLRELEDEQIRKIEESRTH